MVRAIWIGLMAVICLGATPAAAHSKLFKDDAPLKIVITAPFPALVRAAPTSRNAFPATLEVTDAEGPPETLPIQLSPRGLTRRTAGICSFPPLLLDFDKSTTQNSLFKGQHKLKLVTYCSPMSDSEQRIILEYLAYKIYNLITPLSYRVRAAEVTYRTSESDPGLTRFGYLLEDINDVADRNDKDRLKAAPRQITAAQLDPHVAGEAALFEYMISNLDWEFLAGPAGADCCHNIKLLAARNATAATATGVAPVPFDFDYSGLVDAPYAVTPENLPVQEVTTRFYRGFCVSTGEMPSVIEEYRSHRAEITALIDGQANLKPSFRDKADRYLAAFFATLDDPGRTQSEIIKHCR
jgi:hypothetical protein